MASISAIHLTNSKNWSGGTRQAILLCKGLVARGCKILFLAPPSSSSLKLAKEQGLQTDTLTFGNIFDQWKTSRRLRAIVRDFNPTIVHSHHTKAHNVALMATFGGCFPPVVANRGVLFKPEFPLKFRSSRTSAIIVNSRKVKSVLAKCRVPEEKIHVVYNGKTAADPDSLAEILPKLREEFKLDGRRPVIGAVGNGRPEKGFSFLIEAAPEILKVFSNAVFILVGVNAERLAEQLESLGVRDRFVLPGRRTDAVDIMGLFDLFVLPSIGMESCPNVLLEAMGAGCPVVGSDVGGVAEIMQNGLTGLVVRPGDPAELAKASVELLSDPERAAKMGALARKRIQTEFTFDLKVAKTLEVYEKVLKT